MAALLKAARKSGRYRLRDETAVLLAYRHGLRATELVSLQWNQKQMAAGYCPNTGAMNSRAERGRR